MIKLGPAGTSGLGYEEGLNKCKKLGLQALEVEFTYVINKDVLRIGVMAKSGILISYRNRKGTKGEIYG